MFRLARPVSFDKFTRLQVSIENINVSSSRNATTFVGICVYEQSPSVGSRLSRDQCLRFYSPKDTGNLDINIGHLMKGKKTTLGYIGILSDGYLDTLIKSIAIVHGEQTSIFDENGCKDPNAATMGSGLNTTCICVDGFVSSNGGKQQGPIDSCTRCVDSDYCRFDGESCSRTDECYATSCQGNICKPRVSKMLVGVDK